MFAPRVSHLMPGSTSDAELLAVLLRIEAKLDAALDPDATRLQSLLPAIWAMTQGMTFEVGDLKTLAGNTFGLTPPQLGLLLKRNSHRTVGGYRIDRVRRREWSVTLTDGLPAPAHNARQSNKRSA